MKFENNNPYLFIKACKAHEEMKKIKVIMRTVLIKTFRLPKFRIIIKLITNIDNMAANDAVLDPVVNSEYKIHTEKPLDNTLYMLAIFGTIIIGKIIDRLIPKIKPT
tara:strand:- start:218 stop:538 length:321 start_codon:yes stop_codon:yes gene_type:complete